MSISRDRIITLAAKKAIEAGRAKKNELRKQIIDRVIDRAVRLLSHRDDTEDTTKLRKQIQERISEELRNNIGNIRNVDGGTAVITSCALNLCLHGFNVQLGNDTKH